jgi:hypothetical protein
MSMTPPIRIEPPDQDVMSPDDSKKALGISDTAQDQVISAALGTAVDALDPSTNGSLRRALRPQTRELELKSFIATVSREVDVLRRSCNSRISYTQNSLVSSPRRYLLGRLT